MRNSELQDAREVVMRLHELSTPGSERCGLPDETKEAVRLYVQTWILPQAERWLERVERRADKRRTHGGYVVGQRVEYQLDARCDHHAWVEAEVTDVQRAHGVARNRIPGRVTIRTLQGGTNYTVAWRSKRLRRIK